MRTHTLVGVDAALFMLISKYGFTDVLQPRLVVLDPSRVAAQIGNPPAAQVGHRHLGAAGPLVPKLLAAGQPVRACVQSRSSAEYLHALGVQEVVIGDLSEPTVLAWAIQGAEKVYQLGPTAHPRERDMGFAMVDAAKTAGVRHLVFSSVLHAITTDLVQHKIKRDTRSTCSRRALSSRSCSRRTTCSP